MRKAQCVYDQEYVCSIHARLSVASRGAYVRAHTVPPLATQHLSQLATFPLSTRSRYLFGRERKVADVPLDHPSCSSQHAVLQYRRVSVSSE